jgi:hypothetical protein
MTPHEQLVTALNALRPGAQWVLLGDALGDLEWLDTEQSVPTQAEVDAQSQKQNGPQSVTPLLKLQSIIQAVGSRGLFPIP